MGTELSLPKGFGAVSSVFGGNNTGTNDELGAGVNSSYGIVGYKGKVWSIRFGGEDKPLMREDGDGPRNSIEVVLVKASPAISKIFYKNGYVEGSNAAPDCWSADGIKPDSSVQAKCNATCADCPMNAWGSRVTDAGKQGKQCADSRRVAVIPAEDMDNELFGGPMLLRIPAASLKDLKAYGDLLSSYQYPYYAAVTRIAFDPKEAYPKFVFNAVRPLTDAEAAKVMLMRDDKRVGTVLAETASGVGAGAAGETKKTVASSPFEQDATPAAGATAGTSAQEPAKTTAASQASTAAQGPTEEEKAAAAKKAAAAEKKRLAAEAAAKAAAEAARLAALADADEDEDEVDPETGEVTPAGNTPASFDAMLDAIL
jgi:hypothetical protein